MKIKNRIWPISITLIMGLFMLFWIWFIPFSAARRDSLVSVDYYQKGIDYQKTIDRVTAAKEAERLFNLKVEKDSLLLIIQPKQVDKMFGEVLCIRPNAKHMDKLVPLNISEKGLQKIYLTPGVWNINIIWEDEFNQFQQIERVIIP